MFGAYLKAARLRAGKSVPETASAIGVGDDAIYRFERDANSPSMETLDRLAAAFGRLAGDLLPNSGGDFALSETLQPVAAAMIGLDADEASELVLTLASQARLIRNAIARRQRDVDHTTAMEQQMYTSIPNSNSGKTDELRDVSAYSGESESNETHAHTVRATQTGTAKRKPPKARNR